MNRISIIGLATAILLFSGMAYANDPDVDAQTIPLDQIWAWKMPGTRSAARLDAVKSPTGTTQLPTINKITRILAQRPVEGQKAGPGFVVEGSGKEALENAYAVFSKQKEPTKSVRFGTDVSVVFYSYLCGRYVQIDSVEQAGNLITVNYRFVLHSTAEMTSHFALIPLKGLSEGVAAVEVKEMPAINARGEETKSIPDPLWLVSDSFSFEVMK